LNNFSTKKQKTMKKLLFILILFNFLFAKLFAQNRSIRIESGLHLASCYSMDFSTQPNRDLFYKYTAFRNKSAIAFRLLRTKKTFGIEIGGSYSGYTSVARIDGKTFGLTGKNKFGNIKRHYSQAEIPFRLLFYLKKAKKATKHQKGFNPEIIGSIGFHFAIVLQDFRGFDEGTIMKQTNNDSFQQLDYQFYASSFAGSGGFAGEIGLNMEGYIRKKIKLLCAVRLVHGISPMTTNVFAYNYYKISPTENFSKKGQSVIFSNGDSVTFSVGFAYILKNLFKK
jgi:hypothetical protein